MTARLIADTPDHTDLGPATPDTLAVVRPGQTGPSIAVWVD